jgi:Protein of unknown function (DUF2786)
MTHETDQEKRSALLDKITALLAKTQANGCTEAEAIASAELAQKLMAKYGLSLSELESVSSPSDACESDGAPIGNKRCHEVMHLISEIAFYTDTRSWYQKYGWIQTAKGKHRRHDHHGIIAVFFGLAADVQVAIYLTNTFRTALDTEWKAYWKSNRLSSSFSARTARTNFMRGMISSLQNRLIDLKEAQSQDNTNDCRQIVLVKTRIVAEAYEDLELKPRRAGDRVPIAAGALPETMA